MKIRKLKIRIKDDNIDQVKERIISLAKTYNTDFLLSNVIFIDIENCNYSKLKYIKNIEIEPERSLMMPGISDFLDDADKHWIN